MMGFLIKIELIVRINHNKNLQIISISKKRTKIIALGYRKV